MNSAKMTAPWEWYCSNGTILIIDSESVNTVFSYDQGQEQKCTGEMGGGWVQHDRKENRQQERGGGMMVWRSKIKQRIKSHKSRAKDERWEEHSSVVLSVFFFVSQSRLSQVFENVKQRSRPLTASIVMLDEIRCSFQFCFASLYVWTFIYLWWVYSRWCHPQTNYRMTFNLETRS